jgi:hypothetical protein
MGIFPYKIETNLETTMIGTGGYPNGTKAVPLRTSQGRVVVRAVKTSMLRCLHWKHHSALILRGKEVQVKCRLGRVEGGL